MIGTTLRVKLSTRAVRLSDPDSDEGHRQAVLVAAHSRCCLKYAP
jgi:hypothetical protein